MTAKREIREVSAQFYAALKRMLNDGVHGPVRSGAWKITITIPMCPRRKRGSISTLSCLPPSRSLDRPLRPPPV
jgi:hypothetical protein